MAKKITSAEIHDAVRGGLDHLRDAMGPESNEDSGAKAKTFLAALGRATAMDNADTGRAKTALALAKVGGIKGAPIRRLFADLTGYDASGEAITETRQALASGESKAYVTETAR